MENLLKPYFVAANNRLQLLDPSAIDWIMDIVEPLEEQGQAHDTIARAVRKMGAPLDKAIKMTAGLNARLMLGMQFWSALTDKGRADPDAAITRTLHRAVFDRSQDARIANARKNEWALRVSIVDDGRTCSAAAKLHGQTFPADKAPRFPLPTCRKPLCRCMHIAVPSSR